MRRLNTPLTIGWLNQGLAPRSRATVLSMHSQSDAFGQIGGGPILGALASIISVRVTLIAGELVLAPALRLYYPLGRRKPVILS